MKRRPTVMDVARRAGVSAMTVSRVVNDGPRVAAATRARVRETIRVLGFVPNRAARSLRSRRSHWITVLGRSPTAAARVDTFSYLADLQAGVIARCRQQGYHAAFDSLAHDETDAVGAVRELTRRLMPDGMLVLPPLADDAALLAALAELVLPVVRIGPRDRAASPTPCVLMDDHAAAREMTQYLLRLGHRRIGFIQGHPEHASSVQRLAGFRAALRAQGLAAAREDIVPGDYSAESGGRAARLLLARSGARPSAIFASNDDMAAGCLAVAHELRLAVPGDVSVVGFDDTYVARMLCPALTTLRQPIYDMGYSAAHQLLALIGGGEATACVTFSHELIGRDSAASPHLL
jgi:LacI family transcriptional regulator